LKYIILLKEKEFVLQRMGSKGIQDKFKFKNKIKKQKKNTWVIIPMVRENSV